MSLLHRALWQGHGDPVPRRKDGLHQRELGCMRIVTVRTRVARAWAARQIPMAIHPAVGAVLVAFELVPMALATQLHHILELDPAAVCQAKGTVVRGIVATQTRKAAMGGMKSLVKLQKLITPIDLGVGLGCRMTIHTRDPHRLAVRIYHSTVYCGRASGLANDYRMKRSGCRPCRRGIFLYLRRGPKFFFSTEYMMHQKSSPKEHYNTKK